MSWCWICFWWQRLGCSKLLRWCERDRIFRKEANQDDFKNWLIGKPNFVWMFILISRALVSEWTIILNGRALKKAFIKSQPQKTSKVDKELGTHKHVLHSKLIIHSNNQFFNHHPQLHTSEKWKVQNCRWHYSIKLFLLLNKSSILAIRLGIRHLYVIFTLLINEFSKFIRIFYPFCIYRFRK